MIIRQIVREIINEMVKDIITTTQSNIKKNKISNLNDVYKSKYPIVTFSSNMAKFDKKIKNFYEKRCIIIEQSSLILIMGKEL